MNSVKSNKETRAILILEMLGRPKEHLVETLNSFIDKINSEDKTVVENKKIHEPTLVKDQKDIYTTYAEVEVKVEDPFLLIILVFKYMPSHLEIISPEEFTLKNTDYNDLLNEITRRMHGYDELAKIFQMNNVALENKLKEIFEKHPEILGEMKENLLNKEVKKDNKIKENKKEKLKKEKKKEK
jgi:hypothetical protein